MGIYFFKKIFFVRTNISLDKEFFLSHTKVLSIKIELTKK